MNGNSITIETIVHTSINKVWEYWNEPRHIDQWMHASDDWQCKCIHNDVLVGGTFLHTLSAKDGSISFDLPGTYTKVEEHKSIEFIMEDGRKVEVNFNIIDDGVHIIETFEPENENTEDVQRTGWQAILNNFTTYTENN